MTSTSFQEVYLIFGSNNYGINIKEFVCCRKTWGKRFLKKMIDVMDGRQKQDGGNVSVRKKAICATQQSLRKRSAIRVSVYEKMVEADDINCWLRGTPVTYLEVEIRKPRQPPDSVKY